MTLVRFLVKLLASLLRNYFPKRPSGEPLHTLPKLYDVLVGFVDAPPHLGQCIALYVVAKGSLLLVIGCFVLFLLSFGGCLMLAWGSLSCDWTRYLPFSSRLQYLLPLHSAYGVCLSWAYYKEGY